MFGIDKLKLSRVLKALATTERRPNTLVSLLPSDYEDRARYNKKFLDTLSTVLSKGLTGLPKGGQYKPSTKATLPILDPERVIGSIGDWYLSMESRFYQYRNSIKLLIVIPSINTICVLTFDKTGFGIGTKLATMELLTWSFKTSEWISHKECSIFRDFNEFKQCLIKAVTYNEFSLCPIPYKDKRVSHLLSRIITNRSRIYKLDDLEFKVDRYGNLYVFKITTGEKLSWSQLSPITQRKAIAL